jgi:hypothetical protein
MTLNQITHQWPLLVNQPDTLAAHPDLPLHGLNGCEVNFRLAQLPKRTDFEAIELRNYTKFAAIEVADLVALRRNIYANQHSKIVNQWAEKLLLYCEIHRAALKKKAFDAFSKKSTVQHIFAQLSAFFLDYYRQTNDLRFLNIQLKLADIDWLKVTNATVGLHWLSIRNYLLTENALQQLSK